MRSGDFLRPLTARGKARRLSSPPQRALFVRLSKEVELRPHETFYDLGAGNGKALLIAEKEFGAKATGFEISLLFYWVAKINLLIHGSRARILAKNFFDQDLHDTDVIFCFLAIRTMQKMEDKLRNELKPGARIIVYAFPLPTMKPLKTITIRINGGFLSINKNVRIN